jgi:hypothetical protein
VTRRPLDDDDRLGRLEGIQQHLEELEGMEHPFLHLPNLFSADPAAEPPYTVSSSFIPEEIGGNIRVIHHDTERDEYEPLDTENRNQMLGSYLPGGYKRRWKDFNIIWQGRWEVVRDTPGRADVAPMFAFGETYSLAELLETETEDYTSLRLPTEDVNVYIPRVMYVERLPYDTVYRWHKDLENIFADSDPMGRTLELGRSDPTTNYFWFRHYLTEPDAERTDLPESSLVEGYRFEPETEFLRCYYASLLTMYEKGDNDTLSETITYEHGGDDMRAFVGAREESQLLLFDVNRARARSQAARVFSERPDIERDVRFSLLHREIWDRLFFEEGVLNHVFQVDPFVKHLIAADYWCRETGTYDAESVFELSVEDLESIVETLLAPEADGGRGRLTLMGYDDARSSSVLATIREHGKEIETILERCRKREPLLDFAEEVLVHSIEHALSTWATDETPAGGSFELWYDVNFQQRDDDIAPVGIYDSIQGGAGIATEVHDHLQSTNSLELDEGLAAQGTCHTAAADEAVLTLLDGADGDVLYDLYNDENQQAFEDPDDGRTESGQKGTGFQHRLREARDQVLGDHADAYNLEDLTSHTENRIRTLFETRETARFYAYIASQYDDIADDLQRTPRSVDLLLHLDRELIRDPRIRNTYRRFAEGTNQRDLSELGERLEELTVQCITACPDCLETEGPNCVHGIKYQLKMLNRRLLTEVCSY